MRLVTYNIQFPRGKDDEFNIERIALGCVRVSTIYSNRERFLKQSTFITNAATDCSMRPLALAQKYMDCVFSDANIQALNDLLTDEFTFKGPFYEPDSADAYIQSLQSDPPQGFEYEMIRSCETESCACFI